MTDCRTRAGGHLHGRGPITVHEPIGKQGQAVLCNQQPLNQLQFSASNMPKFNTSIIDMLKSIIELASP